MRMKRIEQEETQCSLLEERVVALLKKKNYYISAAESCTGGLFLATLVNVSGASAVIKEGFVTYAEEAKRNRLGVKEETLKNYTAVSRQTAEEMAAGLKRVTGAEVAVSITGLAGPDGGTEEMPVGTVFVGCCYKDKVTVERLQLTGDRMQVRKGAVEGALQLVERLLRESEKELPDF